MLFLKFYYSKWIFSSLQNAPIKFKLGIQYFSSLQSKQLSIPLVSFTSLYLIFLKVTVLQPLFTLSTISITSFVVRGNSLTTSLIVSSSPLQTTFWIFSEIDFTSKTLSCISIIPLVELSINSGKARW